MYGRAGLDRFKKAQALEPFAVKPKASSLSPPKAVIQPNSQHPYQDGHMQSQAPLYQKPALDAAASVPPALTPNVTQVGGGQSTWKPPDWAIEHRPGVFYLEVLKDGEVLDQINLDKRRHIFGRQLHTCDFVLDHQSVSRQHAAVVPHKNGSIYVMDLGSAHGTFVANERLTKDTPVELEIGQSLRFAASTRIYFLKKNEAALFPPAPMLTDISLPPTPDPSDEEAVVAYNTLLNRYGIGKSGLVRSTDALSVASSKDDGHSSVRMAKRLKKSRVSFRDQVGGELVEVVGVSDGADVETEPGPLGLKEGSLVGKYESLVQITVVPKGKGHISVKEDNTSPKGVTNKLQEVLNKVKRPNTMKGGMYDDLYGGSLSGKVGSTWAISSGNVNRELSPSNSNGLKAVALSNATSGSSNITNADNDDDDDLFGD